MNLQLQENVSKYLTLCQTITRNDFFPPVFIPIDCIKMVYPNKTKRRLSHTDCTLGFVLCECRHFHDNTEVDGTMYIAAHGERWPAACSSLQGFYR